MQAGMMADPQWYDAKIAGWWLWGICAWIGSGWCSGTGPHTYATTGQGINRQRPHLGNAGQGINRQRPHLGDRNINSALWTTDGAIYSYMRTIAARLRYVRVCCGDWARIVTPGALNHGATVGVFLDPPYADTAGRTANIYNQDSLDIAHDVRRWAIANGDNPRYRIILCGYEGEHEIPVTWRKIAYSDNRAYATSNGGGLNDANRHKERLWFSPACLCVRPTLFEEVLHCDVQPVLTLTNPR